MREVIETSGWSIRKPMITEVSEKIEFIVAHSKRVLSDPLVLPDNMEACIFVASGAVQLGERIIRAPKFWTLHEPDARMVVSLEPATIVIGMFYRVPFDAG